MWINADNQVVSTYLQHVLVGGGGERRPRRGEEGGRGFQLTQTSVNPSLASAVCHHHPKILHQSATEHRKDFAERKGEKKGGGGSEEVTPF